MEIVAKRKGISLNRLLRKSRIPDGEIARRSILHARLFTVGWFSIDFETMGLEGEMGALTRQRNSKKTAFGRPMINAQRPDAFLFALDENET